MKRFVVDSSSLISISESCLMKIVERVAKEPGAEFFITEAVHYESVLHPLQIRRFELNAVRISNAIENGAIKIRAVDANMRTVSDAIQGMANSLFFIKGEAIKLIHKGEAETLALAHSINADAFIVDERTTRMIVEEPKALKEHIERKYSADITVDSRRLNELQAIVGKIRLARSTELVAYAYEKGYFEPDLKQSKLGLEAALYAVKYAGCAVSLNEIKDYLKSVKK